MVEDVQLRPPDTGQIRAAGPDRGKGPGIPGHAGGEPVSGKPGLMAVSWPSAAGRLYTVDASPTLLPPDWQPLPGCIDLPGTGQPLSVELPALQTNGFFRLRVRTP